MGGWHGEDLYLEIVQEGTVEYKDERDGRLRISGIPFQEFHDEGFDIGVGVLSMTVAVDEPPFEEAGQWRMMVDGVPLTKVDRE